MSENVIIILDSISYNSEYFSGVLSFAVLIMDNISDQLALQEN